MEARTLKSLVVKHFDFLREDYELKYDASMNRYFNETFELKVLHENARLSLIVKVNQKERRFLDMMSHIFGKKFIYPKQFSDWILSMGDVDSRLAYDAKLLKENIDEFIKK